MLNNLKRRKPGQFILFSVVLPLLAALLHGSRNKNQTNQYVGRKGGIWGEGLKEFLPNLTNIKITVPPAVELLNNI